MVLITPAADQSWPLPFGSPRRVDGPAPWLEGQVGSPVFRPLLGHSCLSNRKKELWRRLFRGWGRGGSGESSSWV